MECRAQRVLRLVRTGVKDKVFQLQVTVRNIIRVQVVQSTCGWNREYGVWGVESPYVNWHVLNAVCASVRARVSACVRGVCVCVCVSACMRVRAYECSLSYCLREIACEHVHAFDRTKRFANQECRVWLGELCFWLVVELVKELAACATLTASIQRASA